MTASAARWLPAAVWTGCLLLLSSIPPSGGPSIAWDIPFLDKLVHLALYAVLGACLAQTGLRFPAAWLVGAGVGLLDELYQWKVSGRTGDVADWVADGIGVALGLWFVGWVRRRYFHEASR